MGVFRTPHGFKTIPPKPPDRIRDLKGESGVGKAEKDFVSSIGITNRVVDGGIGRRRHDAKHHALVFGRRQLVRRHFPEERA